MAQMHHACTSSCVKLCLTFVFETDEKRPRKASEHESILGTVLADRGHMHNGQQLLDVVHEQLVEQALIALL